jgi:hypothetical protein
LDGIIDLHSLFLALVFVDAHCFTSPISSAHDTVARQTHTHGSDNRIVSMLYRL